MMMSEWHQEAACRGRGPNAFVRGPKSDYGSTRELCETCPVRVECLEFALADESLTGLWGGTTDMERRLIRRRSVA
jgi:WhiB family transcriptional regulator, redox-sensing transcriptional regulator